MRKIHRKFIPLLLAVSMLVQLIPAYAESSYEYELLDEIILVDEGELDDNPSEVNIAHPDNLVADDFELSGDPEQGEDEYQEDMSNKDLSDIVDSTSMVDDLIEDVTPDIVSTPENEMIEPDPNTLDGDIETTYASGLAEDASVRVLYSSRKKAASTISRTFTNNYGDQLDGGYKDMYDAMLQAWGSGGTGRFYVNLTTPLSFQATSEVNDSYKSGKLYQKEDDYALCLEQVRGFVQGGFDAFVYDHPEVFWLRSVNYGFLAPTYQSNSDGTTSVIISHFVVTSGNETWEGAINDIGSVQTAVNNTVEALSSAVSSQPTLGLKVKTIHDYVMEHCYYSEGTYAHTAYGMFCQNGAVVCEGYAKAFKILCDRFGIPTVLGSGDATVGSNAEAHMWNYVKMEDGQWYLLDATWDDTQSNKSAYLLLGSSTVTVSGHTISSERTNYTMFSEANNTKSFVQPALANDAYHEWNILTQKDSACERDGLITYSCPLHGDTREETTPSLGHKWSSWTVTKNPTCISDGLQRRTCQRCGDVEEEKVPATGVHTPSDWVVKEAATCETSGTAITKCTVCGQELSEKQLPATGHHWSDWKTIKQSTCAENGIQERVCSDCEVKETRTLEKLEEHTYGNWTTVVAATCVSDGSKKRVCSVCGDVQIEVVPATGAHKLSSWSTSKAASCKEDGSQYRECEICGQIVETKIIPKTTTHTYSDWTIVKEATCVGTGLKKHSCSICGKIDEAIIPASGIHTSSDWIVDKKAGCEVTGSSIKKCTICGKELSRKQLPALGHTFGNWKTVKPATINSVGTKERACERCGKKETAVLTKLQPYIKFQQSSITLVKGKSQAIGYSIATGDSIKKWTSSKSSVASVSSSGVIRAKKVGTCQITLTLKSGKKAAIKVTIKNPTTEKLTVTAKGMTNNTVTVKKGRSLQIKAVKAPANSVDKVKYVSSNKKIATVSSNGKIKAKKKGTVKITVKSGKISTVITVIVK